MKTKHGFAYAIGVAQLRDALPHACMHYARAEAIVDELYALIPEMYKRELQYMRGMQAIRISKGGAP